MPTPLPQPLLLTASDFNHAVEPVLPALTRYARRLAETSADTDDLVQDTLLKAWAARTSFRPGSNMKAWLMRIARNTFLSGRRTARRQVLWEPEDIARALVSATDQEAAVMLDDLDSAVRQLPVPQRRAFELVVTEGLAYEEAATRLGVELGTVKSQVWRARTALVRRLDTLPEPAAPDPAPAPLPSPPLDLPPRATLYERWKASGSRLIGVPRQLAPA